MKYICLLVMLLGCGVNSNDLNRDTRSSKAGVSIHADSLNCSVTPQTIITGAGIGDVRIGQSIGQVRRLCDVRLDTTVIGTEGLPERIAHIHFLGDSIEVTVDNDRVWRIFINSPLFQTSDSLGVGTQVSRLLRSRGSITGLEGEGALYLLLSEHCGMNFRLAYDIADNEHKENWTQHDLQSIPSDVFVDQILIVGCASNDININPGRDTVAKPYQGMI